MNKLIRNLIFGPPNFFYVRIYKNKMHIRKIGDSIKDIELDAKKLFSTEKTLISEYSIAEEILSKAFSDLGESRLLSKGPMVVIQPMELHSEKLSEVEEKLLKELAYDSKAFRANVWVGKQLTDDEVKEKAKNV